MIRLVFPLPSIVPMLPIIHSAKQNLDFFSSSYKKDKTDSTDIIRISNVWNNIDLVFRDLAYHVIGLKTQYLWVTLTPPLYEDYHNCIFMYSSVYLVDSQCKTNHITNRMGRKSKLQSEKKNCEVWRLKIRITNFKS